MTDINELYYSLRYCDECGGHQKNCEHYWNGWTKGKAFRNAEIINLIKNLAYIDEDGNEMVSEYKDELINLIKTGKFD